MLTLDMPAGESSMDVTTSFQEWQRDTLRAGLLPVIGIAGTTGKSTVLRLVDCIFRKAGLRTATWSDLGVEIRGRRQRGELSGWGLALSRLAEGNIDVAIQELHWSTIHAVGLPAASYPILALTNLRGAPEAPWNENTLNMATHAALKIAEAGHPKGILVLNGDDYSLIEASRKTESMPVVIAHSRESPALSRQLRAERPSMWTENGVFVASTSAGIRHMMPINGTPLTMHGAANFQVTNVMIAASIAGAVGIADQTIISACSEFRSDPDMLPGSFNVWDSGAVRAVVSTLLASWQMKQVLKAINPGSHRRQISVIGDLSSLEFNDVVELGRLLGRYHGAIVLHSNQDDSRVDALRHGITANEFPPLIIHLPTERKAINRAFRTARDNDVVLLLPTGDPGPSCRATSRFIESDADRSDLVRLDGISDF